MSENNNGSLTPYIMSEVGAGGNQASVHSLGLSAEQLKARLYDTSEMLAGGTTLRPRLKMIRKRSKTSHVHTSQYSERSKKIKLEPLPALSTYQNTLYHNIHGPKEPLSSRRLRSDSQALASLEPLPPISDMAIPDTMSANEKCLSESPSLLQVHPSTCIPRPPSTSFINQTARFRHRNLSSAGVMIRMRSSELLMNSDPEMVMTRYFPPLETLTEPLDIVDRLRKEPQLGFLYLTPVEDKQSVNYSPYNLKVVVYSKVDLNDYSTISMAGVTRLCHGNEAVFTVLDQWVKDYTHYQYLSKIKTFAKFRMWKAFSVWRKNVRWRRMDQCMRSLKENLFILHPQLSMALLRIRARCQLSLAGQLLTAIEPNTTYTLEEFKMCHIVKLQLVSISLSEFHLWVKEVVRHACEEALCSEGFIPDHMELEGHVLPGDGTVELHTLPGMEELEVGDEMKQQDPKEKMTYTEQAAKRILCHRLTRFICLCDYLVIVMLHSLSIASIEVMLQTLKAQLSKPISLSDFITPIPDSTDGQELMLQEVYATSGYTPVHMDRSSPSRSLVYMSAGTGRTALTTPTKSAVTSTYKIEREKVSLTEKPLFKSHLLLDTQHLYFDPSQEEFQVGLMEVLASFKDCTLAFPNLIPDPYFHSFTRPLINNKQEDKDCGYGPNLEGIFEDDDYLKELQYEILECLCAAFAIADEYSSKFEPYRLFFEENEKLQIEVFEDAGYDVLYFRKCLGSYRLQHIQVKACPTEKDLGLILVDTKDMKEELLPSPLKCLEMLYEVLPNIAKTMMDGLIQISQDAVIKLEGEPALTIDYVNVLKYMDEIQDKMDGIEEDTDTVKEIYSLIEQYQVPVNPEDMAVYQSLRPEVGRLRSAVDKAMSNRDQYIDKFCRHLNKDIVELSGEVKDIKTDSQKPFVLDPQSDGEKVLRYMDELIAKLNDLQAKAFLFKSYQKDFKVEVTYFEDLEETHAEVKLRQSLWQAQKEWDADYLQWMEAKFDELQPDVVSAQVTRYAKTVYQLEKGLPPNGVVPKLKFKVEAVKDMLPVITDLRSPSLKPRHWLHIEDIIKHMFDPEVTLTLTMLEELQVFDYAEAIQDVAGQASSEASLEAILKKVDDSWKSMEFVVLPHRDAKDAFILGGTDDIQVLLDDSLVNISTIAGSRHVGPVKTRVDEWSKQLALFAETLEEWLECQRNWLYLESIFIAPDIQRQLPNEAKMFVQVDKSWKEAMRQVHKFPNCIRSGTRPGLLEAFRHNNALLEQIQKCLEDYLESKRLIFPRFYFLSNDELLEILSQTRNPQSVQPHLSKCFDAIQSLEFGTGPSRERGAPPVFTNDILAMISPEKETVTLIKQVKARGNVENWLGLVEDSMMVSLKKLTKAGIVDFETKPRHVWATKHASQIVIAVSQIMFCRDLTECLNSEEGSIVDAITVAVKNCITNLNRLAELVRGELPALNRKVIGALITLDVHSRDVVSGMAQNKVSGPHDFEWLKNVRYYWEADIDSCVVCMSNSRYLYNYEYLGASPRLVITPLTDRCYLCLMGALQLDLGGAPAGPAGTGKTETVKDLAKALATQCVVFNCSEGIDFKMMGRFFSGLAQSGAWCCFDEFNRIDIEVLSVIAQQMLTIRSAKSQRAKMFMFEGKEIKLVQTCSTFVTMNPGYAGRTELPDNLKALFRPFAMMVPDYALIAEVILYSEGFESSRKLAQKMTQMYKLCSEQLSQQDHYDFGMRAVKSVLVMAGQLKRENPNIQEDLVLIRALRDSNLPKFLADDAILFSGILSDLFPGVSLPEHDYGSLQLYIENTIVEKNLQIVPSQVCKVIQLYETQLVRHGLMCVGPTGGGKTTIYEVLKDALTSLHRDKHDHYYYQPVHTYVLNPKAISMGELYGEVNRLTLEWKDGLMATIIREVVKDTSEEHKWIVCDGPVDALWIENMNTVLDDNKMLCLANSERIKLTPTIHMMFEVEDLAVASPATVSRCGMVFLDPEVLRWRPYVLTWLQSKFPEQLSDTVKKYIMNLFETYIDPGLKFIRKHAVQGMQAVDLSRVDNVCSLMLSLLCANERDESHVDFKSDPARLHPLITTTFLFGYVWGLGGNLVEASMDAFDTFCRDLFGDNHDVKIPGGSDLYCYYVDLDSKKMELWEKTIPSFSFNPAMLFFDILVPTIDTQRYGYLMEKLSNIDHSVIFTGTTGVGKTVIAKGILKDLQERSNVVNVTINFSAQTSSLQTQEIIESKLERKRKNILGAPLGRRVILFVDDLNMPKLDRYGSQPPVELLRQYQDFRGFYDRDKLYWKQIKDMTICAACAPPGGGRNPITSRMIRHFTMFCLPNPSAMSLKGIFSAITVGFFQAFLQPVKDAAHAIVSASIEIYLRMSTDLLPTPAKSHYLFNLRDLSKCIQGVLQADPGVIREHNHIFRLYCHECQRVFHDRLVDSHDKTYFNTMLSEMSYKHFSKEITAESFEEAPIIFGDFIKIGAVDSDKTYEELTDIKKLGAVLSGYLDDFNMSSSKEMKLVFFLDAIQHVSRIARMIRQPRGNALLVGVGGTGKQSLTCLAAHMCSYKCFQIEITRGYNYDSFHEDLKKLYEMAGEKCEDTVFLFTDTQIVMEEFLEDINNMLNSGEVPNLFASDEFERIIVSTRPSAKEHGISEGDRDGIFNHFIRRVQEKLHMVICMSPVGDSFRSRCRMFPSLVNCCTIDWFTVWPREALLSVAQSFFEHIDLGDEAIKESICDMCVEIHTSVSEMSEVFFAELRRHNYTTPTSYLELINLYLTMLQTKQRQLIIARDRISTGLHKLLETNELVVGMEADLTALAPELEKKSVETEDLMKTLTIDQESAAEVKAIVVKEESIANKKAEETKVIADDAQKDLDQALPGLKAANKALDALDKTDIAEVRVFSKPPELVATVMEAICILFYVRPDWPNAKSVLGDSGLMKKMIEYDKSNIPESLMKKLKKYIDNPKFVPEIVEKTSKACKSMCLWVRAMYLYAEVVKTVEPKRARLKTAQEELDLVMSQLRGKQEKLLSITSKIEDLEAEYEFSVNEKVRLAKNIGQTQARLKRAAKLTTGLADEKIRWTESVQEFDGEISNVAGNVFIAAACVAYNGAFTSSYRARLLNHWIARCKELNIPVSEDFSFINILATPYEIRQWNTDGLPRDSVSIENAVLLTRGRRWPLMIDPQEQANRWICNMEERNGLKKIKLTDANYLRTLENAIRIGTPVLLEEVGEQLDPSIEPVLLKQTFMQGGRLQIRLGDSDIDYDKNFRFYMTTKMSNPHYLPEVCIKVTIINFTVTKSGLEDQLLSDVVRLERPDLEEQRNQLIVNINEAKNELKSIEDQILKLLFESTGNILDDENLIRTLNASKITSSQISRRLTESEHTEIQISAAREKYRLVATRGSVMYFVVASLAEIDPMYQYSLKYFNQLFNLCIEQSEKSSDLQMRLKILLTKITKSVYTIIARGLFERHKLIFSFMLCVEIMQQDGSVSIAEWNYFLRGAPTVVKQRRDKPDAAWLTEQTWRGCLDLEDVLPCFQGLCSDIVTTPVNCKLGSLEVHINPEQWEGYEAERHSQVINPEQWEGYEAERHSQVINPEQWEGYEAERRSQVAVDKEPTKPEIPHGHWDDRLSTFQKLCMIKCFREEKVIFAVVDFVSHNLGPEFVESPPIQLPTLYKDTLNSIPLIFILSPGTDPMSSFLRFAKEMDYIERLHAISLGQGQGPVAEKLIKDATSNGDWVFLQNCHLAASWMLRMEGVIKGFASSDAAIHKDFRLFLSSMPDKCFPVSVLQNSVKVTNEPPKGLRTNVKRAYAEFSATFIEDHVLGDTWRKLVFGICFFHAIIQERKKFGPLGWNIKYEFNDSDRECALDNLSIFLEDEEIPWDALTFITGEITYGGRVTDAWDQRCLRTILKTFFSEQILEPNYTFSPSGIYYAPGGEEIENFYDYIDGLPFSDEPEIFGMHENANIAFQTQETHSLLHQILDVQPRMAGRSGGKTSDELVYEFADSILGKIPDTLDIDKSLPVMFEVNEKGQINSLSTVLSQEVDRFNKLLKVLKESLTKIQRAIKGFVVMSEELEAVYTSFLNNQVPQLWASVAYPSLKPLSSWVKDLVLRLHFIEHWIENGYPKSFWISGFFFPQGFLTGTLQNNARKYNLPIDELSFHYQPLHIYRKQEDYYSAALREEEKTLDGFIPSFEDGVVVHGLFMEAMKWDDDNMVIIDSLHGEMNPPLPMLHMEPRRHHTANASQYNCPLYKTSARAGVLSTTGHSTNFVVAVQLASRHSQDYWIAKGAALLCQLSE